MDDFTFPQETDDVVDVRIVAQAEDVVIGLSCLLFCCVVIGTTSVISEIPMYLYRGSLFAFFPLSNHQMMDQKICHFP